MNKKATKPKRQVVNCIIACRNSMGEPDFTQVRVECNQAQYDNGDHYDAAVRYGLDNDYEQPFVVFDENDGANFCGVNLFDLEKNWSTVPKVSC